MSDTTPQQLAQQISITRVFDAPRELVFRAWIDPDHVARWFGPAGFDTPREGVEIEPRIGGRYHLRMVDPGSGAEHQIRYEIVELVEPELLVLKSEPMPEAGLHHSTLARIELTDTAGRTHLKLTDGPYPEAGGRHAAAGWENAFDELAALVEPSG